MHENSTIKIFDSMGKFIYEIQTVDKQLAIDTTNLTSGIYLVQIISDNQQKVVRKLIVQ